MPIQIRWTNDTTLQLSFLGHWSWKEFRDALDTVSLLIQQNNARVDLMLDMHKVGRLTSSDVMQELKTGATRLQYCPLVGCVVFVGMHALLKSTVEMFVRIHPDFASRYLLAESEEQGVQLIEKFRTKPDLGSGDADRDILGHT